MSGTIFPTRGMTTVRRTNHHQGPETRPKRTGPIATQVKPPANTAELHPEAQRCPSSCEEFRVAILCECAAATSGLFRPVLEREGTNLFLADAGRQELP